MSQAKVKPTKPRRKHADPQAESIPLIRDLTDSFSFNAEYPIPPNLSPDDLLGDASIWLANVRCILETVAAGIADDGSPIQINHADTSGMLYGALALVEMSKAAMDAAHSRVIRK